LIPDGVIGIFQ